jgi:hypothetical protein
MTPCVLSVPSFSRRASNHAHITLISSDACAEACPHRAFRHVHLPPITLSPLTEKCLSPKHAAPTSDANHRGRTRLELSSPVGNASASKHTKLLGKKSTHQSSTPSHHHITRREISQHPCFSRLHFTCTLQAFQAFLSLPRNPCP